MQFTDEQLLKRFEYLKSNRSTLEGHWQELARYGLPERLSTLIQSTPGDRYDPNIYDSTLMHAIQISSAGFHAYLTDPSTRWFALRIEGVEGSNVRDWLSKVEQTIFNTLNSSNFNTQIPMDYKDMFAFGTSHLYSEEQLGKRSIVSFHCRPVSEIFICEDDEGRVDTAYRDCEMTSRQASQKFGNEAGENVKRNMDAGNTEEHVEFLHVILPREERNIEKRDYLNMPIASIWFDYKSKKKVRESGYPEFPIYTTRFSKTSGQAYGSTPGMIALPEEKMLNQMSKTNIKIAQKALNPPIILPDDGYILPFKQTPGAVNMKNASAQGEMEIMKVPDKLMFGLEMEDRRRAVINSIMFTDLFLMLAQLRDQQRTALEITERVNERMIILSAVIGSVTQDKLEPLISRVFNILWHNGKLPPPPQEVQGKEIHVEFVSKLALVQKMAGAGRIIEMTNLLLSMANVLPEVTDLPNVEKIGREIAKAFNLENLLHDEKELRAIWEAKQQAALQAQQLEQLQQGSQVVGDLAKAGKAGKEEAVAGQG